MTSPGCVATGRTWRRGSTPLSGANRASGVGVLANPFKRYHLAASLRVDPMRDGPLGR